MPEAVTVSEKWTFLTGFHATTPRTKSDLAVNKVKVIQGGHHLNELGSA